MSDEVQIHRNAVIENIATMIVCLLLVSVIAVSTNDSTCLWGFLVLLNLNTYKRDTDSEKAKS